MEVVVIHQCLNPFPHSHLLYGAETVYLEYGFMAASEHHATLVQYKQTPFPAMSVTGGKSV